MAVANAIAAVQAGASHVQGTINGFGERCGNADLLSIVANLRLKLGYDCLPAANIKRLTEVSRFVGEVGNMVLQNNQPYVGKSAFAHKGGVHINAVLKHPQTFELLVRRITGKKNNFFEFGKVEVSAENLADEHPTARAEVIVKVHGKTGWGRETGDGPVNALDKALRKALIGFYPSLADMHLSDFKVRVLDQKAGTAAKVRVFIESRDLKRVWTTVGISENIIEASWKALVDSIEYKLLNDAPAKKK
jgi:2-isopropylmalate synthase